MWSAQLEVRCCRKLCMRRGARSCQEGKIAVFPARRCPYPRGPASHDPAQSRNHAHGPAPHGPTPSGRDVALGWRHTPAASGAFRNHPKLTSKAVAHGLHWYGHVYVYLCSGLLGHAPVALRIAVVRRRTPFLCRSVQAAAGLPKHVAKGGGSNSSSSKSRRAGACGCMLVQSVVSVRP